MARRELLGPVRGLTVKQPWAAAIAHGSKRVENRTWRTRRRGWILISAGKAVDSASLGDPMVVSAGLSPRHLVRGAIVALGRLVDCHPDDGRCSLWSARGQWHWVLDDVRALTEPVPCRGALGLWTAPPEVLDAVKRQLR